MNKDELKQLIDKTLKPYKGVIWGCCRAEEGVLGGQYDRVIVSVIPFEEMLGLEDYHEPHFREVQYATFPIRNDLEARMGEMLKAHEIPYHIVTLPDLSKTLTAEFSVKEAARLAGLGWVGKNNLLITPEYGPRISMSGILVKADLDVGVPMDASRCGECRRCVDACLFKVLSGVEWRPGISREEMVDYRKCHTGRDRAKATKLGRKLACGKCIAACPYGRENKGEGSEKR